MTGWCKKCHRLSLRYSLAGDQPGFLAERTEAIFHNDCRCDNQEITQAMADAWEAEYRPEYHKMAIS